MRIWMILPLILMGCGLVGQRQTPDIATRGAVCGMLDIQGEEIGRVEGEMPGCGIENAVRVTSVGGVALSKASVMECGTARTLNTWVKTDVDRVLGIRGGGVEELQVALDYHCKTRNSRAGAKISEHGKGKAIDISAFNFRDGSSLSVGEHWGEGRDGRLLRRLHASACGPFGTVLGPEADQFHQKHFHFDTASHRGGAYCR
jgi:hypothetical protein